MKKIHIAILMAAEAVLLCAGVAIAARNSSGTMVAISGPYTAGSVISSTVLNARFADIENELTNSVDKGGRTVMTAPLPLSNGTAALPSLTFGSDTDTGLYRIGANNPAISAGTTKVQEWSTTGTSVTGTLAASGDVTASSKVGIGGAPSTYPLEIAQTGTATSVLASFQESALADGNFVQTYLGKAAGTNTSGVLTYTKNATAANSTFCLGIFGASASTLCVDGNNKTILGGGTGISASYRGTTSWNPGIVANLACATTTISLTGAASGAECSIALPSTAPAADFIYSCAVTANTCTLSACNTSGGNLTGVNSTYGCRVWNP